MLKNKGVKDGGTPWGWYYEFHKEKVKSKKQSLANRSRPGRINNFVFYCIVVSLDKILRRKK